MEIWDPLSRPGMEEAFRPQDGSEPDRVILTKPFPGVSVVGSRLRTHLPIRRPRNHRSLDLRTWRSPQRILLLP